MADYGSFCPIALGSDVVADRWTPLILREMVLGNTRFNEIARCLPGISRSLLAQRLKQLERKGVVETRPLSTGRGYEYHLTPAGRDLEPVLLALGRWAIEWLFEQLDPHDVDAVSLMWWMHRRIAPDRLPTERVVVQFDHTAPERVSLWMVFDRGDVSLCMQYPGFDPDVIVTTTTHALAEVFSGRTSWRTAHSTGAVTITGPRHFVREFPTWFLWSPFRDDTAAYLARTNRASYRSPPSGR